VSRGPVISDTAGRVAAATRPAPAPAARPSGGRARAGGLAPGHVFVLPYVVLLALFGVIPVLYSLYLALTRPTGGFAGLGNFIQTAEDYRFLPAIEHVAAYLVLWLVSLTILVTVLALVVHRLAARRTRAFIRFAYYIPGALAGASSVLLWLFVLNPSVSPVSALLRAAGQTQFTGVITPGHLPVVFTVIAFWTGAGGWILILYGALNTIPADLMEAARVDGAGPVAVAWRLQLPMIGKWIVYMLILSLAAGTQLFVEPELVSQASFGVVSNYYSVNQLAYQYAFTQNNFNGAAAISIDLLIVSLACAGVLIARGRLFRTD
jgi:multiple sugar transport system permease protein